MLAWLRCMFRGRHNPVRHPLGGFLCADCREIGADLEEMGFAGGGYVNPTRRLYDRDGASLVQTTSWERGRRGW